MNLRNEQGDVVLKRQVSTQWDRVRKFFDELRELAQPEGGFMAIVEISSSRSAGSTIGC